MVKFREVETAGVFREDHQREERYAKTSTFLTGVPGVHC